MLSVIAMRRPEDEELGGRGDADEFVDISQMQLLVEGGGGGAAAAGPSGLHYAGPQPPHAQPQPYHHPPNNTVDDLFALYFTPTSQHGELAFGMHIDVLCWHDAFVITAFTYHSNIEYC